jgi:hypothetical protein
MFDTTQHGTVETHRYRSYYDAQKDSPTQCAHCGRIIRYCYAMHDQHGRTFVIGTCDFARYRGLRAYAELKAAQVLQEALLKNIRHDLKFYGDKAEVRERRKAWAHARRNGEKLVRTWVMVKGEWLPERLYTLRQAAGEKPRQYKRPSAAVRWYQQQTEKIISLTNDAASI